MLKMVEKPIWVFCASGEPIYESCLNKVEKMLYKKVKKAENLKDMQFYAFSYYYDKGVDLGIIGMLMLLLLLLLLCVSL